MRFLSGVVIGALLIVGAAYVRDASIDPSRDHDARQMVNWEVASGAARMAGEWMREEIGWIGQQLHRQG